MFTVYIDDSGTAPDQQVAIATALVIPAARIVALDREWENLTVKESFDNFHMSECVALNKSSCFALWDQDKQRRVISRVRQIGKKFGLAAASLAINKSDYDELLSDALRKYAGRYHYTWAIRNMIGLLDKWVAAFNVTPPLEYIYDWMDPKAQKKQKAEIDTVMAQAEAHARERGDSGRYANYGFRKRQNIPALQCSDAIAWTCYQFALFAINKTPLSKVAQECWDDFYGHRNNTWLYAATMTREQLQDWIEREQRDGRGLERFRAWEATHTKDV